jgi:hypothetical protein
MSDPGSLLRCARVIMHLVDRRPQHLSRLFETGSGRPDLNPGAA